MLPSPSESPIPISDAAVLTGFLALGLAMVHLLASRLQFLRENPRSRWLSVGGGVSVAYVFVHLLPDLSAAQGTLQQSLHSGLGFLEHHVYFLALVGLAVFYGLERAAHRSRRQNRQEGQGDVASYEIFWLHMGSFTLYNALIGYLLVHRDAPGMANLLLFAIAMALHFIVNDYGLHEHHNAMYTQVGRWILAAAVIVGWSIGIGTEISGAAIAILFSFLSGGIVLNVLKEELPEDRESQFWAFALGAGGYSALLMAL